MNNYEEQAAMAALIERMRNELFEYHRWAGRSEEELEEYYIGMKKEAAETFAEQNEAVVSVHHYSFAPETDPLIGDLEELYFHLKSEGFDSDAKTIQLAGHRLKVIEALASKAVESIHAEMVKNGWNLSQEASIAIDDLLGVIEGR